MAHRLSNVTLTRKDRLKQLKAREQAWFDLRFVKAMAPDKRSRCLDLLEASHAQLRQDIFVLAQPGFRTGGFFVEFGATDGVEFSNTLMLERDHGWTGILAEPATIWHDALRANRRAAIDPRCVWKESGQKITFTQTPRAENSAISPFVNAGRKIRGQSYQVETVSLDDLLTAHGAPETIDYLSVDTEGSEYEILAALDFDRWSFRVLTVEHNFARQRADIHALLTDKGYVRVLEEVSRFDDWYVRPG